MIENIELDLSEQDIKLIQEAIVASLRLSEASASLLAPYGSDEFNASLGAAMFNEFLISVIKDEVEK